MTLLVFNTLTRQKEAFQPLEPGKVNLYVCGPTVYADPHPGHARSAVVFDVIRRYFHVRGYQVTLVRNLTDIDDKIIDAANRLNRDFRTVAAHYARRYQEAMACLNVQTPDAQPKATEFIAPVQTFISKLIQSGHAYAVKGDVFFATTSLKSYGKFSGRDDQLAGMADAGPGTAKKRHPADFSLWKAAKPREPSWSSPWGPGRPGWHIECSAMSAHLLGPQFDIHGGGEDLIFPHHENEIAQSTAVFGKPPARFWIHNGLVHANGEKLSKSLANYASLNELLAVHSPMALRLLMLSKRHRHPLHYTPDALTAATRNAERLQRFFSQANLRPDENGNGTYRKSSLWTRFCQAMDDDFNFPMVLSMVFESVRAVNRQLHSPHTSPNLPLSDHPTVILSALTVICRDVLGLDVTAKAID